ncbi:MAG TPA: anti-sigma factor [Thermoanaerobaculia bacterium]|nr:anti-sigma factor [Thermoanaerobaculia bacterium]
MNRPPDHTTYREWLNLDVDGMLPDEDRVRLEEHLASCSECRHEKDELVALDGLLRSSTLAVRPDFRESVMASLPAVGWEGRAPRSWGFPAAMFILLGGIAAAFFTTGPATSPGLGALSAVFGMFEAALLAGAGLLTATWKGWGMIFDELLSSPVSLGVFGLFVLCLNLLLISLIRRKRPAAAVIMAGGSRSGEGDRR